MSLKLAPGAGETAQWVSARCVDRRPDLQSVTPVNVGGRDPAAQHWEVEEQAGPGTCWAAILAKQPAPGPRSKPVSGHKAESHSKRATASSGLCMHTPQTHLSSNVMFYVTFILPQSNKILKKKKVTSLLSNFQIKFTPSLSTGSHSRTQTSWNLLCSPGWFPTRVTPPLSSES